MSCTVRNKDRFGNTLSIEQMLKKFKKEVDKAGILKDYKKHDAFMSKPEKRKLKSKEHQRLMRKFK